MNNNDNEINENKNEEPVQNNVEQKKEEVPMETVKNEESSKTSSTNKSNTAEPAIETVKSVAFKVLDVLKKAFFAAKNFVQKNLVLVIVAIVALVALIVGFNIFTRSPKDAVKDYIKAFSKADSKKMEQVIDFVGQKAFNDCYNKSNYDYDLEDFNDNYKDITKDSDEVEEINESAETFLENFEKLDTDDLEIEIKEFISVSKVKNSNKLTKVKVKVSVKKDGEKETGNITFYTMKKGLNNYIVGIEDSSSVL
ncbi:MAG: hypothetical protein LBL91_01245 [Lachnospiraceae bacterium]|jgi:hypothetical protein|nr:hypothetical protein [Lachnospiraceae bacterium]